MVIASAVQTLRIHLGIPSFRHLHLGGILDLGQKARHMADTTSDPLAALAVHAVGYVRDGDVVGLGTGHAAGAFVRALGTRVRSGLRVHGVATSEASARLAQEVGIELIGLEADIALTVDGADEVDGKLQLIKGRGGALVRERIVAAASRRQVILVTSDKLVDTLGNRGPLPVEVLPFALPLCRHRLENLGLKPSLRMHEDGPFVTDNFNVILDCATGPIDDPVRLERTIRAIPGVIDTGLFLDTAERVVVADGDSIRELLRTPR
jgi:ribose 5-phosphate isomerase A